MHLDVGAIQRRVGLEKTCPFREGGCNHAGPVLAPLQHVPEQVDGACQTDPEIIRILRFVGEDEIKVILQVLSDARQFVHHGDAVLLDVLGAANAGQLQ